jgi:hypothetical protein
MLISTNTQDPKKNEAHTAGKTRARVTVDLRIWVVSSTKIIFVCMYNDRSLFTHA